MICALIISSSRLICKASLLRPLAQLPFTSHMSRGIVFLQLNCDCVPLIVTLPITGTTPWYLPRDTQSRGPSLLLTLVHIEQNVKSTSHVPYSFLILAAKLLCFLASIAMQNIAVCGIRNGRWKVRHSSLFWRGTFLVPKVINWVTIWQSISFTILP